jgi:hypothetical protein
MRAKYHSNCTLFEAKRGKNPSFAWRSIQSACDLINEGLIWRIDSSAKVWIWQDKWLPLHSTYMVQSPPALLSPMATVEELIDGNSKQWNKSLLDTFFSDEERKIIQSLSISHTDQEDFQIW